jgi:hypothetical protein
MKWEKQFDHAFKVINPNIKAITEGWNADDLERVKQRAEFEYSPPRRHATEAVEEECPLMALSGHLFLRRTCLLSGVKRTSFSQRVPRLRTQERSGVATIG